MVETVIKALLAMTISSWTNKDSGLGFMLHHAHEENLSCPIASYECDGGILGDVYIYDTEEQAAKVWNRRVDNG